MKKFLVALILSLMIFSLTGCGGEEKNFENNNEQSPVQKNEPTMTAFDVINLQNHPRLNDEVANIREFYKNFPNNFVQIVDKDDSEVNSVLYFKKRYQDQSVGKYEQKDLGEAYKLVCNLSKTGANMSFEEAKPLILSYFPIEIVRENFELDKSLRFFNNNGNVVYGWSYKTNRKNLYRGKPVYGENLTVMVNEVNGKVTAFGMFINNKNEKFSFLPSDVGSYKVEPYDVQFYY